MNYLQTNTISVEKIVHELYDFSQPGVLSIPDVLTEKAVKDIIDGVQRSRHLFKKADANKNNVLQDMENLYVEEIYPDALDYRFYFTIRQFLSEYQEFYNFLANVAQYTSDQFNSLGFNYYPPASQGITPHQDFKSDRDLISIFNIYGSAKFFVCRDRNKNGSIELPSYPGSLMLMRAARNDEEQAYRPIHYLEPQTERVTMLARRSVLL